MNEGSERKYWLNLFTLSTWRQFLGAGGRTAGFREQRWSTVQQLAPGDCLLCYLTGVSRFIGALTVIEQPYFERSPLWAENLFPARVRVKPMVTLTPETAVPLAELTEQLSFFRTQQQARSWSAHLRGSPTRWLQTDGERVLETLLDAKVHPVVRTADSRRLARMPPLLLPKLGAFTVLDSTADDATAVNVGGFREPSSHTEIQYLLLEIGSRMGLDIWVARNDRGREHNQRRFADLPGFLQELPRQFDEATMRTIEMIDVLWLERGAIVAAFEIESTTTVYSGLLRLSDLIAMQPNLNIPLYIAAPDERRDKVKAEINRATFSRLSPPLYRICRLLTFSALRAKAYEAGPVLKYLRPEFIHEIAEDCTPPKSGRR